MGRRIDRSSSGLLARPEPEEMLLYPPTVLSYNWPEGDPRNGRECREIPYDLYQEAIAKKHVWDLVVHHVAAPGTGHQTYQITRMDSTGVYGVLYADTSRILTIEEVR